MTAIPKALAFFLLSLTLSPPVELQTSTQPVSPARPLVFLFDGKRLLDIRQRIRTGDKSLEPAMIRLREDTQKALSTPPQSVVYKDATPPSGDKHDYMSQAPYFWRNPKTPDGLPYVRRDGERNPEIQRISDRDGPVSYTHLTLPTIYSV